MNYYKMVRVLRNNQRVSLFIDPGDFFLPGAKMLHYYTDRVITDETGIGIWLIVEPDNDGNKIRGNCSNVKPIKCVEIWQVEPLVAVGKKTDYNDWSYRCKSIRLTKLVSKFTNYGVCIWQNHTPS